MDYRTIGSIVFLILLAIAVLGYVQSARTGDALDRRRRAAVDRDRTPETHGLN